jgi:hypothetical protein
MDENAVFLPSVRAENRAHGGVCPCIEEFLYHDAESV